MATTFEETLRKLQLDDLVVNVDSITNNYVICSRFDTKKREWLIIASDGTAVWNKSENTTGVEQLLLANDQINSLEDYLKEFKKCIQSERPKISHQTDHLDIISSSGNVQWRLVKCDPQQQAAELSSLLFYLATQVQSLKKQVQESQNNASLPVTRMSTTNLSPAMNLDSHRKGGTNKLRHKKGMSLVNPGSKKLKGAHGIEFE